jgi:predicted ester cyclase
LPRPKATQEGEKAVSEENKALMHRFYEEFVHPGNLNVAEEIIAPDCPLYFGSMFMGTGPEAFKQTRTMMYSGFPDLRWTIDEIIAEGETVAERLTGRGTHQGEFMDVPPTGSRVEIPNIAMARIREGKIVEMRGAPDMLGLMQQIGAVPAPEQSEEATPT